MKPLIILFSLLVLISCSSHRVNKHYYRLSSGCMPQQKVSVQKNSNVIWVASVTLAGFLDQEGIIYQIKPFEYIVANDHRWASPLAGQLKDILVNNLSVLLPNNFISTTPIDASKITVDVFIDGFHGAYDGNVILKGYWLITRENGKSIQKRFYHRIAQSQDGYSALINILSIGWQNEINQLVKSVNLSVAHE